MQQQRQQWQQQQDIWVLVDLISVFNQDLLEDLCRQHYAALPPGRLLTLRSQLVLLQNRTGGRLSLATGCSGTDIIAHCFNILIREWKELFGLSFYLVHDLSCEEVPMKQRFIKHHWSPKHIVGDLHTLSDTVVQDIDGAIVSVGRSLVWACGVECDSISNLNNNRAQAKDCIAEDDKASRTGSTARSCMSFIAKTRPLFFLLENVKNLTACGKTGGSNLMELIKLANESGYFVIHTVQSPDQYGIPQTRGRFYILGLMVCPRAIDQSVESFRSPLWVSDFKMMLREMRIALLPITRFLLEDDHPDVIEANSAPEHRQSGEGRPKKKPKRPRRRGSSRRRRLQQRPMRWRRREQTRTSWRKSMRWTISTSTARPE